MNKKLTKIRINKKKMNIVFLIIVILMIGVSFLEYNLDYGPKNLYIWLIFNLNSPPTAVVEFPIVYLILMSWVLSFSIIDVNFLSRITDRKALFLSDLALIFYTTFIYFVSITGMMILIGLPTLLLQNKWTNPSLNWFKLSLSSLPNQSVSLFLQMMLSLLGFMIFLLFLGYLYHFLHLITKNGVFSFLVDILIIGLQTYFFVSGSNGILLQLMPITHDVIYLDKGKNFSSFISIPESLIYWILIFTLLFTGIYYIYRKRRLI